MNVTRSEVVGTNSHSGAPPPVHVVGYAHSKGWDEGPDSGTPFGSYFKGSRGSDDGEHEKEEVTNDDRRKLTQKLPTETESRVMFADMPPRAPR